MRRLIPPSLLATRRGAQLCSPCGRPVGRREATDHPPGGGLKLKSVRRFEASILPHAPENWGLVGVTGGS